MKQQLVKDKEWVNESGQKVPVEYISPGQRLQERYAYSLLKEAKRINGMLLQFKQGTQKMSKEVFEIMMKEYKAKPDSKGNYCFFNFDRSIKVEVTISDRIEFEDLAIEACKGKLNEFLDGNLTGKQDFVKELVADAFSTQKGKLDAKKVMSLLKYRMKIKDPLFQDALNLLEGSIRRPDSKMYFRIWERNEDGGYSNVDLNFSSL